jgi:hypothetical protein
MCPVISTRCLMLSHYSYSCPNTQIDACVPCFVGPEAPVLSTSAMHVHSRRAHTCNDTSDRQRHVQGDSQTHMCHGQCDAGSHENSSQCEVSLGTTTVMLCRQKNGEARKTMRATSCLCKRACTRAKTLEQLNSKERCG